MQVKGLPKGCGHAMPSLTVLATLLHSVRVVPRSTHGSPELTCAIGAW